jgi:hypothetical protein
MGLSPLKLLLLDGLLEANARSTVVGDPMKVSATRFSGQPRYGLFIPISR